MEAKVAAPSEEGAAESVPRDGRGDLIVRVAAGVATAVLIALAVRLPIWQASLTAPQYPKGLYLAAYGDRVEGDVDEITELNHYVGMRPYDVADFPEMGLWIPTVAACLAAAAVSVWFGRRLPGRLARLFVWLVPLGALADVQLRLHQYGHDLKEGAALRLDPFTPLVVGPTKVLNFTTWARPGTALLVLWLAAAVLTLGPGLIGRAVGLGKRAVAESTESVKPYVARR